MIYYINQSAPNGGDGSKERPFQSGAVVIEHGAMWDIAFYPSHGRPQAWRVEPGYDPAIHIHLVGIKDRHWEPLDPDTFALIVLVAEAERVTERLSQDSLDT